MTAAISPRVHGALPGARRLARASPRGARAQKRGAARAAARVGCYIERGGITNDRMELRFDPGGGVTILAGTHSHGQGHATTYAQMVAEWLGVPFDQIRFVQGDTDAVPFGRGTYAARSSLVGGCALKLAADAIIDKARSMAAFLMEAAPDDVAVHGRDLRDRRHRPRDGACRRGEGVLSPGGLPPQLRLGARGKRQHGRPIRRTIPMAATSARSRSIPRPARVALAAMPSSTMLAVSSIR